MQTIAIVNEKGGTAKTTTAVNFSAALGEMKRTVLLVDLDGQAASSRWLGVEENTSFAEALWSGEGFSPVPDVIPGVSLAPGSGKLDSVAHDLRPTQGGQLRRLLSEVSGYDYVVIDCPPSLGNRLIGNALLAATHAIVPVETSILALDGLKILLTTFKDIHEGFGHEIILSGVLACRYDARTKLSRAVLAELKRALPGKVFQTVIRENVRLRECPASGQSILVYAPDSYGAEDYRSFAREFLGMPVEGFVPEVSAEESLEGTMTEEERVTITEMRRQLEPVLRRYDSPPESRDASVSGYSPEPTEETPGEAQSAVAAQPEETPAQPTWQPDQTAAGAPAGEAPSAEPGSDAGTDQAAADDPGQADQQDLEVQPAEPERTPADEPPESEQVWVIGPLETQVPAGATADQSTAPAETDLSPDAAMTEPKPDDDAGEEAVPSQSDSEPESETDWASQEDADADEPRLGDLLSPAAGEESLADEAEGDNHAWEVTLSDAGGLTPLEAAGDAAPGEEQNPPEDAADQHDGYPALRAMLRKMAAEDGLTVLDDAESEPAAVKRSD